MGDVGRDAADLARHIAGNAAVDGDQTRPAWTRDLNAKIKARADAMVRTMVRTGWPPTCASG